MWPDGGWLGLAHPESSSLAWISTGVEVEPKLMTWRHTCISIHRALGTLTLVEDGVTTINQTKHAKIVTAMKVK